jgi:hypothetical protein
MIDILIVGNKNKIYSEHRNVNLEVEVRRRNVRSVSPPLEVTQLRVTFFHLLWEPYIRILYTSSSLIIEWWLLV